MSDELQSYFDRSGRGSYHSGMGLRARDWAMRSLLASVAMAVAPGCSSDEEENSSTSAVAEKLSQCGLLVDERTLITAARNDSESCAVACLVSSPCDALGAYLCAGGLPDSTLDCVENCRPHSPAADQPFTCDGGQVPQYLGVCNALTDCQDGTDEAACPAMPAFRCDNGQFVQMKKRCNGTADCTDGSDENCTLTCRGMPY
jgi:hypothetical protein